jgi:hypothetical protein
VWLFLVLLALLAYFVLRHLAAERQARELSMAQHRAALALEVKQHQHELATFDHEQDGVRWEFDFDAMTVELDYRTYDLKRSDGGVWHYRPPESAHRERLVEQAPGVSEGPARAPLEPQWQAVPEALAAKVESRYERFLRHYRG